MHVPQRVEVLTKRDHSPGKRPEACRPREQPVTYCRPLVRQRHQDDEEEEKVETKEIKGVERRLSRVLLPADLQRQPYHPHSNDVSKQAKKEEEGKDKGKEKEKETRSTSARTSFGGHHTVQAKGKVLMPAASSYRIYLQNETNRRCNCVLWYWLC